MYNLIASLWRTHLLVSTPITLNGKDYPLGRVYCTRCGQGLDGSWLRWLFCWER
jgi:hypothetical protein